MKEVRQSNFELLRIVAIAMIVTHHYVVNSTVMDQFAQGGHQLSFSKIDWSMGQDGDQSICHDERILYVYECINGEEIF